MTPRRALEPGARYTLVVGAALRAGDLRLGRPAVRAFTTGSLAEAAPILCAGRSARRRRRSGAQPARDPRRLVQAHAARPLRGGPRRRRGVAVGLRRPADHARRTARRRPPLAGGGPYRRRRRPAAVRRSARFLDGKRAAHPGAAARWAAAGGGRYLPGGALRHLAGDLCGAVRGRPLPRQSFPVHGLAVGVGHPRPRYAARRSQGRVDAARMGREHRARGA